MPTPVTRPTNLQLPFASSGAKNTINVASSSPNASFTDGFPPVTMLPITAGGVPPQGKDFNGILYDITKHTLWVNAGGQYQFDAALSTAIGGYPVGMVLQNNAGTASYVSAVANNTTDFNSNPASIGTLWLPYSGSSFSNVSIATTGGTTVLTAIQAAAKFITVTGALVSDATLTLPAALGKWTVINNTTGAHSVSVIALSGTGVPIFQGGADTVYCDAANVHYDSASAVTKSFGDSSKALATTEFVQATVGSVGGYYQDTGAVANAYIITPIPPLASYVTGQSFRIRTTRTNTAATTLDAGLGAKPLVIESGGATQAGDIHGVFTVTYDSTVGGGSWLMNGEAVSELGACAKENIGLGLEDDGSGNLRVKLADSSLRRTASGIQTNDALSSVGGGTQVIGSANHGGSFLLTANETFSAPACSSLWNGFNVTIIARDGTATFTPNGTDRVNNGTPGQSYTLVQGQSACLVCDGAGNWQPQFVTTAPGATPPKYINAATTIAAGVYLVDTSAGAFTLTLTSSPVNGDSIEIIDAKGTFSPNNLTLGRNGLTIMGVAENLICNVIGSEFRLWYDANNGPTWRLQ